jgi:hypothetical protein
VSDLNVRIIGARRLSHLNVRRLSTMTHNTIDWDKQIEDPEKERQQPLFDDLKSRFLNNPGSNIATFYGVDIRSLSRSELIAAIHLLDSNLRSVTHVES